MLVALSGGVDSAVTALLLQRAGHDVQALFMHNWDDDGSGHCTSAQDFQDARRVADHLQIPLHAVDLSLEYRERVFAQFLAESRAGRTPNPDVLCNREIKFGECQRHALRLGAQGLATGHYAQLVRLPDGMALLKGADADKDQSYFLHDVPLDRFDHALMPLGQLRKAEVRRLARDAGLPVHAKPDSTGICFIGERPFRAFLAEHLAPEPGPIKTPEGLTLGEHAGLANFTLGQRGGIGVGGRANAAQAPWYVIRKEPATHTLWVAQQSDHPWLMSRRVWVSQVNWLHEPALTEAAIQVKFRYRQADQPGRLQKLADQQVLIETRDSQRAVTPGQSAVFYQGDRCLGGGVIERTEL